MTEYEKCKHIRTTLLIAIGENMVYTNWNERTQAENVQNLKTDLLDNDFIVDPTSLSENEMREIGFPLWDVRDDETSLYLMPIWLTPFLKKGLQMTTISGETITTPHADNDHRFGAVAYGVIPAK